MAPGICSSAAADAEITGKRTNEVVRRRETVHRAIRLVRINSRSERDCDRADHGCCVARLDPVCYGLGRFLLHGWREMASLGNPVAKGVFNGCIPGYIASNDRVDL